MRDDRNTAFSYTSLVPMGWTVVVSRPSARPARPHTAVAPASCTVVDDTGADVGIIDTNPGGWLTVSYVRPNDQGARWLWRLGYVRTVREAIDLVVCAVVTEAQITFTEVDG